MGKKWDYDIPKVEVWKEALRVLKPGGHILCACGTRTQHRMAVNLEDAGFEIRDIVAWVYGSGFPKSHNIGKAVDKLQGNEREVVGEKPTLHHGTKDNVQKYGYATEGNIDITKGSSPYEGWGTALKPAMELWTLCRKPLEEKTVASNTLKYGTGGINIDGCRVEGENTRLNGRKKESDDNNEIFTGYGSQEKGEKNYGRFPANIILDGSDEVVGLFPNTTTHGVKTPYDNGASKGINLGGGQVTPYETTSGSASRFFYCAKASKSERNKGLDGVDEKGKVFNGQSDKPSKEVKDVEKRFNTKPTKNFHPTVKPIKLMEYLVRLVTKPKGVVLDPFGGSGSTGIACVNQGFKFILFDNEQEYVDIAKARIKSYSRQRVFD